MELTTNEETYGRASMDSVDMVVSESLMLANWITSMADYLSVLSKTSFQQSENRTSAHMKSNELMILLRLTNSHLKAILGSGLATNSNKSTERKSL